MLVSSIVSLCTTQPVRIQDVYLKLLELLLELLLVNLYTSFTKVLHLIPLQTDAYIADPLITK